MRARQRYYSFQDILIPESLDERQVVQIDLVAELIKPHPIHREVYGDTKSLDGLVESIEREKLHEPIYIDQDYYIISGWRRYQAFKKLKRKTIPAYVVQTLDEAERVRLILTSNIQRTRPTETRLREAMAYEEHFRAGMRAANGSGRVRDQVSEMFFEKRVGGQSFDRGKQAVELINRFSNPLWGQEVPRVQNQQLANWLRQTLNEKSINAAHSWVQAFELSAPWFKSANKNKRRIGRNVLKMLKAGQGNQALNYVQNQLSLRSAESKNSDVRNKHFAVNSPTLQLSDLQLASRPELLTVLLSMGIDPPKEVPPGREGDRLLLRLVLKARGVDSDELLQEEALDTQMHRDGKLRRPSETAKWEVAGSPERSELVIRFDDAELFEQMLEICVGLTEAKIENILGYIRQPNWPGLGQSLVDVDELKHVAKENAKTEWGGLSDVY